MHQKILKCLGTANFKRKVLMKPCHSALSKAKPTDRLSNLAEVLLLTSTEIRKKERGTSSLIFKF